MSSSNRLRAAAGVWIFAGMLANACNQSTGEMPPATAQKDPDPPGASSRPNEVFVAPVSPREDRQRYAHVPSPIGLGRPATAEEIAAWDMDVKPDGTGLPEGRGTVAEGEKLYTRLCTQCHGAKGEDGDYEALVGPEPRDEFPFGREPSLQPTIGDYWPYATTLFDYTRRAMPQAVPGTLQPDQVYSLVAYLLYLNEIVPEDAVLDQATLPQVVMPARDRFVMDNRRGGTEIR